MFCFIYNLYSCSFEYDISLPKVCCLWGSQSEDGKNFSGLVGDLFNGYSDIGWANIFFNYERSTFIDLGEPYIFDYAAFMVKYQVLNQCLFKKIPCCNS